MIPLISSLVLPLCFAVGDRREIISIERRVNGRGREQVVVPVLGI